MKSFAEFKLPRQFLNAIADLNFEVPTSIQEKAIPAILSGQDVMGIAQTGTGKTAAYLLPLLRILNFATGKEPRAVILLPTRELALQIGDVFDQLAKYTDLRKAVVYGGAGAKKQIAEIENGIDVIIGTPGRFLELYSEGYLVVKKVKHLVVDEAERLMDISFISQFHRVLEVLPTKKQNLLFSATMSDLVKKIADDFLKFPVIIDIEPERKTAETVEHIYIKAPNLKTKINLLDHLLNDKSYQKVIIFCRTKATASNVGKYIVRKYGVDLVRVVHGNKTQQSRINAMNDFKSKDIRLLVTTDVAARGLDVADVSHVINLDVPIIYEDYVHRIGRTGRALKKGKAITFVSMADEYHLGKIEKLVKQKIKELKIPKDVVIEETSFEEQQLMLREIDEQRRKEDPSFQGAFHTKKGGPQI